MRVELSNFLVSRAKENPKFVVLSGDHGYALFDELRTKFPKQFLNVGVAEQSMVGYAAGLAKAGYRVAVYGLAAFVPCRVFEFIKMDVCYDSLPIIFIGDGAGLVYNSLGASHQCAEDVAMLRTLPNIEILSPADKYELRQCANFAYQSDKASYLRIGKSDKPEIHKGHLNPGIPHLLEVKKGSSKRLLIATGSMVATAFDVGQKIGATVLTCPRLTSLEFSELVPFMVGIEQIVTLEEHSINGGLGSIVAEVLSERGISGVRLKRIGIKNRFTEKNGSYEYAIKEHELDFDSILENCLDFR